MLDDLTAGQVLGRYELLLPIARGGMASVWAARLRGTRGFQKMVAIKTMLPGLVDDLHFERMFLDEASLASQVRHPHVIEHGPAADQRLASGTVGVAHNAATGQVQPQLGAIGDPLPGLGVVQ